MVLSGVGRPHVLWGGGVQGESWTKDYSLQRHLWNQEEPGGALGGYHPLRNSPGVGNIGGGKGSGRGREKE